MAKEYGIYKVEAINLMVGDFCDNFCVVTNSIDLTRIKGHEQERADVQECLSKLYCENCPFSTLAPHGYMDEKEEEER